MPLMPSQVHAVDVPLTNVSVAYAQESGYVSGTACPSVRVQKQNDRYYIFPKAGWHLSEAQLRAPGQESAGGTTTLSTATYSCDVVAYHENLPDETAANADAGLNLSMAITRNVTNKIMLKREQDFVTACMATSIWATDSTPGTLWSAAGSSPIADIRAQCLTIVGSTGFWPTDLFLSAAVWAALEDNSDFISRISFGTASSPSIVAPNLLAQILGLKRVHIMRSIVNTANEGASASMAFTSVKDALLCYLPDSPGLMTPSAFYRFDWEPFAGAAEIRIKRMRDEFRQSDRIEGQTAYDFKVVGTDLGCFFSNAVA